MTVELGLAGQILDRVQFGYATRLQFTDLHEVIVETPLRLTISGERVDVPADTEWSEPVSALVGDRVLTADTLGSGTLQIVFESGAELLVEPNPEYESWTVTGPGGMLVVCRPGGDLTIWSARK